MKSRLFTLMVGLVGVLLGSAITVAFAYTSHDVETPKIQNQKNDLVFNWGQSS